MNLDYGQKVLRRQWQFLIGIAKTSVDVTDTTISDVLIDDTIKQIKMLHQNLLNFLCNVHQGITELDNLFVSSQNTHEVDFALPRELWKDFRITGMLGELAECGHRCRVSQTAGYPQLSMSLRYIKRKKVGEFWRQEVLQHDVLRVTFSFGYKHSHVC